MTVAMVAMLMMVVVIVVMVLAAVLVIVVVMLETMFVVMVVFMIMVMVVSAGALVLVHVEVNTGIFHRMHHGVLQLSRVDIDDGCHEVEIGLLGWLQMIVVLDTDLQIRQVQSDSFPIDGDGHLDVSHQIACLALDPLADLQHHRVKSRFRIGVEAVYVSGETDTDASDHVC